jgi:hypothetical protein
VPRRRGNRPVATLRAIAAGIALLAASQEAAALSSGAPRGTPLVGRPLQISIPVSWDRGEAPPCVRAEFLQGESPGGPLRWRLDQTSEGNGLLRLGSSLPVQEPVVSVQIALGCGQQYTREYVLLAEPPSAARDTQAAGDAGTDLPVALAPLALAPATSLGPAKPADPPARTAAAAAPAASATPAASSTASPTPAPRPQRAKRAHAGAPRPAAAPQKHEDASRRHEDAPRLASAKPAPAAEKPSGPRLTLEPLDVEVDEAPVLRLTGSLAPSAPAASGGLPRSDARELWQALNTTPEQQAAQAQAAAALQTELKAMRELVQRYGAETRATTQRLEQVSGERDLMLHVLLGLVVVLGGGFGYLLWLRSRENRVLRSWWEEEHRTPVVKPAKPATPVAAPAAAAPTAAADAPPSEAPATDPSTAPEDLLELPDFLELDQGRVLSAEELLGLKEKADFFLAVGQPEKAVQLLESQLQEHASSPFVWLDLLDLCRRLERSEDYERLRLAFQKLFSARIPAFQAATPESHGLEDHPRALSRITQLWGTPRVLKVIEESLFEEAKPGSINFDLEASRDLLLLYGIASEALAQSAERENIGAAFPATMRSPLVPTTAPETEPVPLAALDQVQWPAARLPPEGAAQLQAAGTAPAENAPLMEWATAPVVPPQVDVAPAPAPRPAPAVAEAAAPDIDLGHLHPLLPDLDFSLSLSPAVPAEPVR